MEDKGFAYTISVPKPYKNDKEYFAPEDILSHKQINDNILYLVSWIDLKGNQIKSNSWEIPRSREMLHLAINYELDTIMAIMKEKRYLSPYVKLKRKPIFWKSPGYFGIRNWKYLSTPKIVGATYLAHPTDIYFFVKFREIHHLFIVKKEVAIEKCPLQVMRYYKKIFYDKSYI
ncbi:uncharacterized protein LOC115882535 [Sitophilus oryzae]|uniref:Uncharacterized protein LOC115882535 n=1 Tax=Sitophilus oryzae TaxID=7048 RepID=A0A6J2XYI0_SITOR|nr:uncharacterized protein LOC115882535 [Sitophilus oryzae]